MTSPITFTGPVYLTLSVDIPALAVHILDPILTRLNTLEVAVTQNFATVDEALAALDAKADALAEAEAADRAAFDSLAAVVRAFLANLPPAGGTLTDEQSAQADAILAKLDAVAASDAGEATDEAALAAELPPSA